MTALPELLRMSRWHLNEKRQKLGDLERLHKRLEGDLERLDAGIAREQELAANDPESMRLYPAYLEAELERRRRLEQTIAEVGREIEAAREEVAEAFRELKKYELADRNHRQREHRKAEHSEQQALDELGTQLHRRGRSRGGEER